MYRKKIYTAIGKKQRDFVFETIDGVLLPFDEKLTLLDNIHYVILYQIVNYKCHLLKSKFWCFFEKQETEKF